MFSQSVDTPGRIGHIRSKIQLPKPPNDPSVQTIYEDLESLLSLYQIQTISLLSQHQKTRAYIDFLTHRWQRIRGTSLCYTHAPNHPVNQLCIDIAKRIAESISTAEQFQDLEKGQGLYFLLMPSLTSDTDVYGENIHLLGLNEFVLSDDEKVIIPIKTCLYQASVSEEGRLRHVVDIDGIYPWLSESEIQRIKVHSKAARELHDAIEALNQIRIFGNNIAAKLTQLSSNLKAGGVHAAGEEFNAGQSANLGILEFHEYWQKLPKAEQDRIFTEVPELEQILGRLFRPNDTNYQEARYCVELLANNLDTVIGRLNRDYNLASLQRNVQTKIQGFESSLKSNKHVHQIKMNHPTIPFVLPAIYRYSLDIQRQLLGNYSEHRSLIQLILNTNLNLLKDLDLTSEDKAHIKGITHHSEKKYPLLVLAAANDNVSLVEYFVEKVGFEVDCIDSNGDSSLSFAASRGNTEIVVYLLSSGANINIQNHDGNTPLLQAVIKKHIHVIEYLLNHGAQSDLRNEENKNVFDYAMQIIEKSSSYGFLTEYENQLINILLVKMAALPLDQQKNYLKKYDEENALQFVINHRPQLIQSLIEHVDEMGLASLKDEMLMTVDKKGRYLLHKAVTSDSINVLTALLDSGFNINIQDIQSGSTALHEAVVNKNTLITCSLFSHSSAHPEQYLDITIKDEFNKTALDYALESHEQNLICCFEFYLESLPVLRQRELIFSLYDDQPIFWNNYLVQRSVNELIQLLSPQLISSQHEEFEHLLTTKDYENHLNLVIKLCKKYLNASNTVAANAAKQLLIDLFKANNKLLFDESPIPVKIQELKQNCIDAIEQAKPHLKDYWEWVNVLAKFMLMILTFPVSLPLYTMGLFSLKTYTEQTINQLGQDFTRVM